MFTTGLIMPGTEQNLSVATQEGSVYLPAIDGTECSAVW